MKRNWNTMINKPLIYSKIFRGIAIVVSKFLEETESKTT